MVIDLSAIGFEADGEGQMGLTYPRVGSSVEEGQYKEEGKWGLKSLAAYQSESYGNQQQFSGPQAL